MRRRQTAWMSASDPGSPAAKLLPCLVQEWVEACDFQACQAENARQMANIRAGRAYGLLLLDGSPAAGSLLLLAQRQ